MDNSLFASPSAHHRQVVQGVLLFSLLLVGQGSRVLDLECSSINYRLYMQDQLTTVDNTTYSPLESINPSTFVQLYMPVAQQLEINDCHIQELLVVNVFTVLLNDSSIIMV